MCNILCKYNEKEGTNILYDAWNEMPSLLFAALNILFFFFLVRYEEKLLKCSEADIFTDFLSPRGWASVSA